MKTAFALCLVMFTAPALARSSPGVPSSAPPVSAQEEGRLEAERLTFERASLAEADLNRRMSANRDAYGRLLGALERFSSDPPPALVVSPGSANDAVRAAILMRAMMPELARRAREMQSQAQTYEAARRRMALANARLLADESRLAERSVEMAHTGPTPSTPVEAEARMTGFIDGLDAPVADVTGATGGPARLLAPVRGQLVGRFGRAAPGAPHSEGLTWLAGAAHPVVAPAAGRVVFAGPLKGWGQVVVFDLGGDWRLVLAGLDGLTLGAGASVARGQALAILPRTGGSRRIYLELRLKDAPIDPMSRLDAR